MPGRGIGISPVFRRGGGGLPSDLILWLNAEEGKTLVGSKVSQWNDQTSNNNDAVQGTDANRPTDNTTYLTFDGDDNMSIPDNASLDIKSKLSLYSKFLTSSVTAFMGLLDKYLGAGSGYMLYLNASVIPVISAYFSKTNVDVAALSSVSDGLQHEVLATIDCSRKFTNKQFLFDGEEPEVIKDGSTYYCFYDRWDGSQYNIYRRSSTSPYFEDSVETLVLSNLHYPSIYFDGTEYRLVVTDNANQNFLLYTSATIDGTYTLDGTIITYGDVYDSDHIADPHEIKIGSTYYIYWTAFIGSSTGTIAYATSATGAPGSYTKVGTCVSNGVGQFDATLCADPNVHVLPNGNYVMFYTGYNSAISKQQQGFATSPDGVTWTKFANNPVHYFTGESFDVGTLGPNEPSIIIEDGIVRMYYRTGGGLAATEYKICYTEFAISGSTIDAGSETVTIKVYLDGVLDTTQQLTGQLGIDYIVPNSQDLFVGGDNASTLRFDGRIYEAKIWNSIQTP